MNKNEKEKIKGGFEVAKKIKIKNEKKKLKEPLLSDVHGHP